MMPGGFAHVDWLHCEPGRAELRANVTMAYYESGHMMYVRPSDLAKRKRDAAAFCAQALAR